MRVTPTHLADGRELFYFDDSEPFASGQATRRLDDPRPLSPPDHQSAPEMRLDPLAGEWIAMASDRMERTFMPAAKSCPLCPAQPGAAYQDGEIPDADYDVVVFENRFPAFARPADQAIDAGWSLDDDPIWPVRPAAGRCEVICFSPDHDASLSTLPPSRVRTVIDAWAVRTEALQRLNGIAQVFPFENHGREIGVTLPHPHGQIYAFPYLPPKTAALVRQAQAYSLRTGGHLLNDLTRAEVQSGRRLVAQTGHWIAYVPAAARWPVEVILAPRQDRLDLPALNPSERDDLSHLLPWLFGGLNHYFAGAKGQPIDMPYIAAWHQAPLAPELRALGRLQLQLFSTRRAPDKLKHLAGSESAMGAWLADTVPERIAERLRAVLAPLDHV